MRARSSLLLSLVTAFLTAFPALAAITGTVINGDGAPVAGAKVSLFSPETPEARRLRILSKTPDRVPLVFATTGTNGSFSIDTPSARSSSIWRAARPTRT